MHIATISSKQQITIPKHMLQALGLVQKEKLFLDVENGRLVALPVTESIVNRVAGSVSVAKNKKGKSIKEIMRITKRKTAAKLAKS